ncbi:MAG: aminotransferase class III-fold pyridoxal phosphate-dependent enzyme, partial [Ornithinibacter sp.]
GAVALRGATHSLVVAGLEEVASGTILAGSPVGTIPDSVRVWLVAGRDHDGVPPAFVRATELAAWESRLLDPGPLLGLDSTRMPVPPPAEALARRTDSYSGLQGHYYASPPQIERGWQEHLIDTRSRHYVDMVNNVTVLGHGHPRVAGAAADQWRMLNTNSRFHYGGVADLSERLLATLPDSFDTVLLVNSGSEAVDLALRLTKAYTARGDVVCLSESYHGWTLASDAVSTSLSDNPIAGSTRSDWVHVTTTPNAYRGPHRGPGAGSAYAAEALALLERLERDGRPAGTFIAEPRQGNAGAIEVPEGYLARVYDAVHAGGGVCISDEVQVGYGRQGDVFWGYEQHEGVVPDVITVAKAMGNGHPLGAVITRREIADALADQGAFFSSAGGSTVSCRIGVEVLDVISDEGLQANAAEVGTHLGARLADLALRHPMIGAVHGRGLYQGVELVRDRVTLEPATEETVAICDRMLDLGVVVQPTGDRQNILKVKPPLCFTRESADFFVATLDEVLTEGW